MITVNAAAHPAGAVFKPLGYLGPAFNTYRDACSKGGARWDKPSNGNVAGQDAIARVVKFLQEAGFTVNVEPQLVRLLTQAAAAAREVADEAGALAKEAVERALSIGFTLRPFQVEGIAWLASRRATKARSGILADQMGLGKTVQGVCVIPEGGRAVVVAPSIALSVWERHVFSWRKDLRPRIVKDTRSFRWPQPGEVIILNFERMRGEFETNEAGERVRAILPDDLGPCPEDVVLIADEAHAFKSREAQRTMRFEALAKAVLSRDGSCYPMTGTPILNRPPELWTLLQLCGLDKEAFPGGLREFERLFGKTAWGWPATPRPEVVERLRRVILRRERKDVLPDLPTKSYDFLEAEITTEAREELDLIAEKILAEHGIDLKGATLEALAALDKVAFEDCSRIRRVLAESKIPAMLKVVEEHEEQDEPLVVFSWHRGPVEVLRNRPGWATITGGMSSEERGRIEQEFQAGKLKGVALTISAGGTAITLTNACRVLFVDRAWTPALNEQAEDRVCRIGQTRGVVILNLIADHVMDSNVADKLVFKGALIAASTEASTVVVAPESTLAADLEAVARIGGTEGKVRPSREAEEKLAKVAPAQGPKPKRPAKDARERFAADGIITLSGLDTDHARIINGVGFSKFDGEMGHSFAKQLMGDGLLTDRQWEWVLRLANRYRKQIGAFAEVNA